MAEHNQQEEADLFWQKNFFQSHPPTRALRRTKHDLNIPPNPGKASLSNASGELWLSSLFSGVSTDIASDGWLRVYQKGEVIYEIPLQQLPEQTFIGRHPDVDLQLECQKMAMFHAAIYRTDNGLRLANLDTQAGIVIGHKKLQPHVRVKILDGMKVDLPTYRLEFCLPGFPPFIEGNDDNLKEVADVPDYFYQPPPPPPSPLLINLVDNFSQLKVWDGGDITLKVVDIIEETANCKTFRMVAIEPLLFSYKPGQFVTFLLTINGSEVRRAYSLSSSPSRPHLLELTVKRVPGGLVSNWLCDQIKLGDKLTIKGPSGKFTCFNYPSSKMLFIAAGSGITPIMSMCRWIADTAADVDVVLLLSFKSPADIIFRKELELLSARHHSFRVALTVTSDWCGSESWTGLTGRVSQAMLAMLVPDLHERDVYSCGPEAFAENVVAILRDMNFDLARYHCESFGAARSAPVKQGENTALSLSGILHKVNFTKSGITVDTDEHVTLLELAEAHGIEIDYSCRAGSCGECEVKCKGEVNVSPLCGIDEKTRKAGYIYSCCSVAAADLELEA